MRRKMLAALVLFAAIIAMMTWMAKQGQKITKIRQAPANAEAAQNTEQPAIPAQMPTEEISAEPQTDMTAETSVLANEIPAEN